MGLPFNLLLSADTKFITVGEITALTANAIYPESENDLAWVGCQINHKEALRKAIKAGMVTPLNPLSYEQHTFPFGDALQKAVISLADLKRFAETLQIEVVIGDEPFPRQDDVANTQTHLTIDEAASALAEKYGFNENTTNTMRAQLMDAAKSGDLTVRHPHTLLPYRPDTRRDFYELVSLSDLNAWLKTQGVEYQLPIAEQEQYRASDEISKGITGLVGTPGAKCEAVLATNANIQAWKVNARQIGIKILATKPSFNVDKISEKTHIEMTHRKTKGEPGMTGRGGKVPSAGTIKRHALIGIKS